ncbi:MAG: methanol--corrinoid methyltransferase, partial [Candidatus Sumerlaeia bacterium]|nr:methanol--corrinoid methyltransferase [Candidatus Sumerlaeia bacterium]
MAPKLNISTLENFHFGRAPRPVKCGRGVEIGGGKVVPEINFTLPPIDIEEKNWASIPRQYSSMIEGVTRR